VWGVELPGGAVAPAAPVEYRGIHVGRVQRLLLHELAAEAADRTTEPIPVLIRVEPGRLTLPDSEEGKSRLREAIETGVGRGLRATLSSGNVVTGSLYVSLDFYPNEGPGEMGVFSGRPTIPTIASGLTGLEQKLSGVLDKVNALPLADTLGRIEETLTSLNASLASEDTRSVPESLNATLAELTAVLGSVSAESALQERLLDTVGELDRTLEHFGNLLDTLDEQPNALIFNRDPPKDPLPPAGPR
jgi:paraquat-inducible protein B